MATAIDALRCSLKKAESGKHMVSIWLACVPHSGVQQLQAHRDNKTNHSCQSSLVGSLNLKKHAGPWDHQSKPPTRGCAKPLRFSPSPCHLPHSKQSATLSSQPFSGRSRSASSVTLTPALRARPGLPVFARSPGAEDLRSWGNPKGTGIPGCQMIPGAWFSIHPEFRIFTEFPCSDVGLLCIWV